MTRKQAIKILKWIAEIYDNKNTVYENQALTMAIEAIEEKQAGGWISVKDRLPEEPEEALTAKEMAEVACALDLLKKYQSVGSAEHFQELSNAEHDGRLVVLPCKAGDTVWTNFAMSGWYFRDKDKPYSARVVFIGLNNSDAMGKGVINVAYGKNNYMMQFSFSDIGKTVFLTREEAEAALKKKEADDETV